MTDDTAARKLSDVPRTIGPRAGPFITVSMIIDATNHAAIRLGDEARFAPRWISWFGLIGAAILLFTLPWWAILVGVAIAVRATSARRWLDSHHQRGS